MVKSGIKIFARIRPTKRQIGLYEVGETENGAPTVSIHVPRSEASGYVNNKIETYIFRFNQVFDQSATQDNIFESVAQGVADNCLQGYNGTIFAYGQTGSGKTFTITGGAERYADRGIIPRTLSYLFQQYQKTPGTIYSTHISYLEIYNESGYDLLDPKHEATKLEDLPKVHLMEGSDGNIHLKNLSLHPAANEEEALNWLFLGDTNRMIAETPMNMASTRSHCIFTIHISSREPGSDTIKKAKLHLVDLAGSERIGKTGVGGTLLTEAKCINLSLHFLEQVIVALSEKSRIHVPYRNSMMTSVLRDSLGGNCMTTMIATCSVEKKNIDETISTCRFAQRVAMVKNEAILNEELDPKLMIARLKQQVQDLKDELTVATGEERTEQLTDEEMAKCKQLVQEYVQDPNREARLMVGSDMRKIQLCFSLLKAELLKRSTVEDSSSTSTSIEGESQSNKDKQQTVSSAEQVANKGGRVTSDAELQRLRDLLQQRDDEINVLLKMLKQERRRAGEAELALKEAGLSLDKKRRSSPILGRTSPIRVEGPVPESMTSLVSSVVKSTSSDRHSGTASSAVSAHSTDSAQRPNLSSTLEERSVRRDHATPSSGVVESRSSQDWSAVKAELSQARQEAFDSFRKNYADTSSINEHKKILKIRYSEAKALGKKVNTSRVHINKLKAQIEQHRVSQGIQGLTSTPPSGPDPREEELKKQIEAEKANFKGLYAELRELKTEIEHIQHLLEKAKVQLQKDFEQWWSQQAAANPQESRKAWHTPPTSGSVASLPHHNQTHPPPSPRPPSSSSSSHTRRSHSRSRPRSSRGSNRHQHHSDTLARQEDNRLKTENPPFNSTIGTSLLSSNKTDSSIASTEKYSHSGRLVGHSELSSQRVPATSRDLSISSGVGSSVSSSVGNGGLGQTHGTMSEESFTSSSSLMLSLRERTGSGVPTSSAGESWLGQHQHQRREPDSLPRVGKITGIDDKNSLSHSQTSAQSVTTAHSLHKPKPLFSTDKSASTRSFGSASSVNSSIPLTGDSRADADIIAFYRARQKLIQKDQPR